MTECQNVTVCTRARHGWRSRPSNSCCCSYYLPGGSFKRSRSCSRSRSRSRAAAEHGELPQGLKVTGVQGVVSTSVSSAPPDQGDPCSCPGRPAVERKLAWEQEAVVGAVARGGKPVAGGILSNFLQVDWDLTLSPNLAQCEALG